MNKLTLALATAAIAAGSSTFVTTAAEAGGRGFRMHHFLRQHHLNQQRYAYRHHDDDEGYVRRKKKVTVYAKPVEKPVAKPVAVAVAKYADGEGRQFDLVSKVWFDGTNQCWMGDKPFVFKSGTWFYGTVRWTESNDSWRVASGDAPEQVSCEGIKAFEGKVQQAQTKPATKPVAAKKAEPKPEKIEQAELQPVEKTGKTATTSAPTAKATECKKYFPSVGEMVSVPCNE